MLIHYVKLTPLIIHSVLAILIAVATPFAVSVLVPTAPLPARRIVSVVIAILTLPALAWLINVIEVPQLVVLTAIILLDIKYDEPVASNISPPALNAVLLARFIAAVDNVPVAPVVRPIVVNNVLVVLLAPPPDEYPITLAPIALSHNVSQLPLKPVWPVKNTFLFFQKLVPWGFIGVVVIS